jgi:hypothetical protein
MINVQYIKRQMEIKKEVADLELWLADKEITEYNSWKKLEGNEKSRTAMDKVVAELKKDDEEWNEKEEQLRYLKILTSSMSQVMEVLSKMLSMVTADKISLAEFKAYEEQFKDWFI